MKKKKSLYDFRLYISGLWAILSNSFVAGFVNKTIYKGDLKKVCVPGLNCYSCPGALGSCPVGAIQSVIGKGNSKFTFYVSGILIFLGAVLGRFVCGFLCPFGLLQDLLFKVPFVKKIKRMPIENILNKIKYVILFLFVIILPMFVPSASGTAEPWFCKYICPAGTLEGGIFFTAVNESLRATVGFLYTWKVAILVILLVISVFIYRPFCKILCPLGAIYSLFNKVAIFRYKTDKKKCISCGRCSTVCPMNVNPEFNPNSLECIRCGKCIENCPTDAIGLLLKKK